MKDLQTILDGLDRDQISGRLLPTVQLVQAFYAACPLEREELGALAQCIALCSEQIYEHYRALIDLFRKEVQTTAPDAQTIRLGIDLGLLDDEEWRAE